MKVLALESSSQRGSIALIEGTEPRDARILAFATYEAYNEHAERLLGQLDLVLKRASVGRTEIERIAVGVGPGSFTGVRVALSVAQGLILGLGKPGVGVGSLRAIAAGLGPEDPRVRFVVRDARREELFIAAYDAAGTELVSPHAVPQATAGAYLNQLIAERAELGSHVVVGYHLPGFPYLQTEESAEPDARCVGRIALGLDPSTDLVEPCYVRGPNLIRPKLPPSPLSGPRL